MPLIFAENDATESGIEYADQTGVSYQYPLQYRNIIQPGERFIYYRGRKKEGGGRQPQIYFGAGIVGNISADTGNEARLRCDVLDYRAFQSPVPFKTAKLSYFESGGLRRGYFQRGVRRIDEQEFEAILAAAQIEVAPTDGALPLSFTGTGYAYTEILRAVEKYAVETTLKTLKARYPDCSVVEQARNNPGFDVLVRRAEGDLYVEVKGTRGRLPMFVVTEGEIKFSNSHADSYLLVVVHQIDLTASTHKTFERLGAITESAFRKEPLQWRCVPLSE